MKSIDMWRSGGKREAKTHEAKREDKKRSRGVEREKWKREEMMSVML